MILKIGDINIRVKWGKTFIVSEDGNPKSMAIIHRATALNQAPAKVGEILRLAWQVRGTLASAVRMGAEIAATASKPSGVHTVVTRADGTEINLRLYDDGVIELI